MKYTLLLIGFIYGLISFGQQSFKSDRAFKRYLSKQLKLTQEPDERNFAIKLSPEECQTDLRILKKTLEEAQTTIYRYAEKATVDEAFQKAYEQAQDSLYYIDFLRSICKIQYAIACGHSSWKNDPAYSQYRNKNIGLFPFDLNFHEGNVIIEEDYSLEQKIPKLSILLTVNDVSTDNILEEIKLFMTRDGTSNDNSNHQALMYFKMAYSNFIGNPSQFALSYRAPDSDQIESELITPLTKLKINAIRKKKFPKADQKVQPLVLEIDTISSSARYTIDWFKKEHIQKHGQDFENFTDSVFSTLAHKNIENLFIDLRGNTGGWTAYGNYLFSYFVQDTVPYMKSVLTKKHTDYSFESIKVKDPGYQAPIEMVKTEEQLFAWDNYLSLLTIPADRNHFKGNTYILIDNFTRSCSGMFSSLMREHTDAIFIGEETGATQCGAGGMVGGIKLPHSNIVVTFSTAEYTCAVKNPNNSRGVLPD